MLRPQLPRAAWAGGSRCHDFKHIDSGPVRLWGVRLDPTCCGPPGLKEAGAKALGLPTEVECINGSGLR
ncbi:hypothetical protein NDU88_009910 [Pleurodeles waltl]|uniref:Uncharacterized protein n=1 Tax=Pleurodeles waltl TaxID=8319 RepID=A0AAV7QUV4_PLEWA|nr:hypothetical protein NDU88_009910 [Pleurodeles waltl]